MVKAKRLTSTTPPRPQRRAPAASGPAAGLLAKALAMALATAGLASCGTRPLPVSGSAPPEELAPSFDLAILVVDENGAPIDGVSLEAELTDGARLAAASGTPGRYELAGLRGPALLVLERDGYLPEPVVVGREESDSEVRVKLFSRTGAGGRRRIAMHFAGDVMLGRRYVVPVDSQTAVVRRGDGGASARAVVSSIAPLFAAADLRSLNLETVVGTLPASAAYPRKRFLLQSPPETIAAIEGLETDFVTLGNNHARDWLDGGVASTIVQLQNASIPFVGAGVTPETARTPLVIDRAGYRIGVLSYTSVNGDFVNDNLPPASTPRPIGLPASEAWQYEERIFSFHSANANVPSAARRIREVWDIFRASEDALTAQETILFWNALVATYPELQDWVARRGHGGANPLVTSQLDDDIDAVRALGAEYVIVQLHSGFQFFEVKSSFAETAAYRAIEEGADLVICHHPHVLQGFELYQGKLIAYSLGNFVFDQDFLATFSSAIVRVVLEETAVIEARVYPLALDLYRPVPVAGAAARNIIDLLHERSAEPARSERIDGDVRKVLRTRDPNAAAPRLVFERNSARIEAGAPPTFEVTHTLRHDAVTFLERPGLTRTRASGGAILVDTLLGRDLFGWGSFEDFAADGVSYGGMHWQADASWKRVTVNEEAPVGVRSLRLERTASQSSDTLVRPRARITFRRHNVYTEAGGVATPADPEASYSLHFRARLEGTGTAFLRLDVYHFDDTNPTEDPESELLRSPEYALDLPAGSEWEEVLFDVPAGVFTAVGDLDANALLLYFGLEPPASGTSVLHIDEVRFLEWRDAEQLPDGFQAYDAARASGAGTIVSRTFERTLP